MTDPPRPHLDPGRRPRSIEVDGDEAAEIADAATRFGRLQGHAAPADGPTETLLREAPITGMGQIVYSSNATFLVEFDAADPTNPDEPLRAVYKPARGERPLWDFRRHSLHFREVAAREVDRALGFNFIPPTILRDGPAGPGSMQLFIDSNTASLTDDEATELRDDVLPVLAALDVVINNADRKRAHILLDPANRLYAIDNALSFLPYPRQRTILIGLGGTRAPRKAAAALRSLRNDEPRRAALRERLMSLLTQYEVDAFDGRLDEFAADPIYPALDPWDGQPFEW